MLYEAAFAATAESADDDLHVTIQGRDNGENLFGPVAWTPIDGAFPQQGDDALVAEGDQGRWWVVAWIPSS